MESMGNKGGLFSRLFGRGKNAEGGGKSVIATWGEILHAPPENFSVSYEVAGGIQPWGDVLLQLDRTGGARLENLVVNVRTTWTGRVQPPTFQRLLEALHEGNFPQVLPVPEELFEAGAPVGRLRIDAGKTTGICEIELETGNHDPSCQEAVRILESLCHQLSEGTLGHCKNTLPAVVSEVRKGS
jgi:hypothetical protein